MTMVGLNFTKISAERFGTSDNVRVESNVAITNIVESPMPDPKKSILKFQFDFTVKFEPNIGLMDIKGELIEIFDKELGGKIIDGWVTGKSLHKDVAPRVLNAMLAKSNVEAIILSKELGLPSPVQMPKVEIKPKSPNPIVEQKVDIAPQKSKKK
jgi:hypothetical protein